MDQTSAPILEELLRFIKKSRGNYHVPGHKQGQAFDVEGLRFFTEILSLDLTEVGELDDLHHAIGIIEEAQSLAAKVFFANKTFFLVGGTTAGNLATVLTLCRPDEEMIIQRSCHQSVFNGCMLAGAKLITLPVEVYSGTDIEKSIRPEQLTTLLQENPLVKGVFITSPSYFGVIQPLKELSSICHEFNVPMIVDEAHGAHLGFHEGVPLSAMQCGADVSIQSTHKMLTSMTMSSMLHVRGDLVPFAEISRWLRILQSSSPSYPLLASLDLARRYMVESGASRISEVLELLRELREKIGTLTYIQEATHFSSQDPFKLSIVSRGIFVSGYAMKMWLEENGVFPEMADAKKVLFVFSLGTGREHCEVLFHFLSRLDKVVPGFSSRQPYVDRIHFQYDQPEVSFDEIRRGKQHMVSLGEAVDRTVAEMIIPYPPGIPFLLPGERFTSEKKRVIEMALESGNKVRGITYKSSTPCVCVLQ